MRIRLCARACHSSTARAFVKPQTLNLDQTTKVRGMFVHPGQVADIVRRHREVIKARLVMDGEVARDRMTLQVEVSERPEGLAERIAGSVREVTRLRIDVLLLPPGSLPNDGKLIEDARLSIAISLE